MEPAQPIDISVNEEYEDTNEQEVSGDSQEIANSTRSDFSPINQEAARALTDIQTTDTRIADTIEMRALTDELETTSSSSEDESFTSNDSSMEEGRAAMREANDSLRKTRRGVRRFTRIKWAAFAVGVGSLAIATASFIASLIASGSDKARKEQAKKGGMTDEQIERIAQLVDEWRVMDDATFWDKMAAYVDTWKPSVESQLMFMRYTRTMCKKLPETWTWEKGELSSYYSRLVNEYTATEQFSSIYLMAKGFTRTNPDTSKDEPMPRKMTAHACEYALAIIRKNLLLRASGEVSARPQTRA